MMSTVSVFVGVFLLSLGVVAITLAAFAGLYSSRDRWARAATLLMVGVVALVAMPFALGQPSWTEFWDSLLWPLLLLGAAAGAGVGAGAAFLYFLASAR